MSTSLAVEDVSLSAQQLAWLACYRRLDAEQGSQALPRGLIRLVGWPDPADVPDEFIEPLLRLCALLWCKPTASYLVARALGADARQTATLLRLMLEAGQAELLAARAESTEIEAPAVAAAVTARASFVGKLWKRLLG